MINYFDAVDFDELDRNHNTATTTSGRGGGGGEPTARPSSLAAIAAPIVIPGDRSPGPTTTNDDTDGASKLAINSDARPSLDATMQDHTASNDDASGARSITTFKDGRRLRFNGEYFYIPNTREGQQLAQMITGAKHRRRGSWIVLFARAVQPEITALLSIFNAMSEAITPPRLPEHYEANRNLLIKSGVRGGVVNDLARDPWVTPDIIEAWVSELRSGNPPDKLPAVLLRILQAKLPPPHLLTGAGVYRKGQAVIIDGERCIIDCIMRDGSIIVYSPTGEMYDLPANSQLQLASS